MTWMVWANLIVYFLVYFITELSILVCQTGLFPSGAVGFGFNACCLIVIRRTGYLLSYFYGKIFGEC